MRSIPVGNSADFFFVPHSCHVDQFAFHMFTDCRKMYQCDQCDQICLTTSFLRKHKRLHSDERPHKCSVCDAAFKDKAYLKRHGVKHTGVKEFKCDLCDKLFSHQRKYNKEETFTFLRDVSSFKAYIEVREQVVSMCKVIVKST